MSSELDEVEKKAPVVVRIDFPTVTPTVESRVGTLESYPHVVTVDGFCIHQACKWVSTRRTTVRSASRLELCIFTAQSNEKMEMINSPDRTRHDSRRGASIGDEEEKSEKLETEKD